MRAAPHTRIAATAAIIAASVSCADARPGPVASDPEAASFPTAIAEDLPTCTSDVGGAPLVEVVAEGLEAPWDLVFLPGGRILVTERAGRIRVIENGVLAEEPWATLDVYAVAEAGLMGIDIAPDFATTGHVFVAATFAEEPGGIVSRVRRRILRALPEGGFLADNRIVRFTESNGRGTAPRFLVEGIPGGQLHVGGALRMGPDGMLWMGTGETSDPELARLIDIRSGKILHMRLDGGLPDNQPFDGYAVYAAGFRNVQGLDWHPVTGTLLAIEHGPTGLTAEDRRIGHDELNSVAPGVGYGWPDEAGRVENPRYRPPLLQWTGAVAPAGIAFWRGDPAWDGDLFVGTLRGRDLYRVHLAPEVLPTCTQPLFAGAYGRIRAVRMGPDGWLYFTTSNRDGRGAPGPADDRLMRMRPAPSQ